MVIKVGMLYGKFFLPCHEGAKIEPYWKGMKFDLKWCSYGYEVSYDMRGTRNEKTYPDKKDEKE